MSGEIPSSRTADEPMAFTKDELWAGGGWAWLAFVVLMLTAFAVSMVWSNLSSPRDSVTSAISLAFAILFWVLIIGGIVAFVAMLAAMPLLWLVGRSVRRVRRIAVHLAVYSLIGAAIGVIAMVIGAATNYDPDGFFWSPLLPATVAITSASIVFGWLRASRHARRELRALRDNDPRTPIGLERAFDSEQSPY